MQKVPIDPFDGKELKFKKGMMTLEKHVDGKFTGEIVEKDGYMVYSVGKDGVDNGGTPNKKHGSSGSDITFTVIGKVEN